MATPVTDFIPFIAPPPGKPWRTDSELAMIRDWFYPNRFPPDPYDPPQSDTRQSAANMVHVYPFNDQRTPHALIATGCLAEALAHDAQPDRKKCINNAVMGSIYAMAFVRFVNGFVDKDVAGKPTASLTIIGADYDPEEHTNYADSSSDGERIERPQVKGRGEASMYAYAAKIGMPESFVDLRHQIVHGQLVALSTLKKKTEEGMEWLWKNWWSVHATGDPAQALRKREHKRQHVEEAREEKERKRRKVSSDGEEMNGDDTVEHDT